MYSPKWTSTHYTLMLLRRMGLAPGHPGAIKGCQFILDHGFQHDGGIDVHRTRTQSETCVTGMVLSMVAHFGLEDERIERMVDYLLAEQMADGGWNCEAYRGATHSSVHTTICVLEGLREYDRRETDRAAAVRTAQEGGREFQPQRKVQSGKLRHQAGQDMKSLAGAGGPGPEKRDSSLPEGINAADLFRREGYVRQQRCFTAE